MTTEDTGRITVIGWNVNGIRARRTSTNVRRAQLQPGAISHRASVAGRHEWAATLALVAHYHRELSFSRRALSPGRRPGGDHPPTFPASTHFDGSLETAVAAT